MLFMHKLPVYHFFHNRRFVVMAVETFFAAYQGLAMDKMLMAALAAHFGLFHGLVGNGLLVWFCFCFLGLQGLGGDFVAEYAFAAAYIECDIFKMAEVAFFLGNLEMLLLTLTLMAGGAMDHLSLYPLLFVIMLFMGKGNDPNRLVIPFEFSKLDLLGHVLVFRIAMTLGCCTAQVVDPGLGPDNGILHV